MMNAAWKAAPNDHAAKVGLAEARLAEAKANAEFAESMAGVGKTGVAWVRGGRLCALMFPNASAIPAGFTNARPGVAENRWIPAVSSGGYCMCCATGAFGKPSRANTVPPTASTPISKNGWKPGFSARYGLGA